MAQEMAAKLAPAQALPNGWFWSSFMQEAVGEAQTGFHCSGGAIKYGSNRLPLFNLFIKSRVKPFC
jgi:hypothetical protein